MVGKLRRPRVVFFLIPVEKEIYVGTFAVLFCCTIEQSTGILDTKMYLSINSCLGLLLLTPSLSFMSLTYFVSWFN